MHGLVYSLTEIPAEEKVSWIHRPIVWAMIDAGDSVGFAMVVLVIAYAA